MSVTRRITVGVALLLAFPSVACARSGSLYTGSGPRPGPAILYWPPASAPQLQNIGVWHAAPILVSGTSAYREGEFLYQDYLYDDHGANSGVRDSSDPWSSAGGFSEGDGTYTYPTDPRYANNAADLVELRVKPLSDATAFRITLNSLIDPSLVAATIAIGSSPTPLPVPYGANATAPAQWFLTWHGYQADLRDAASGREAPLAPSVSVDLRRRQIELHVPHADWDPGSGTVRLAAAVGLWDQAHDRYLIPQQDRDATHPGGAGYMSQPEAFFNVAFRYHEPLPTDLGSEWLRDYQQAETLKTGDLSPFYADVDFGKLLRGITDNSGVPATGAMDRILPSHFESEQGVDFSHMCEASSDLLIDYPDWYTCRGQLRGQLQPYAIYVPHKPPPARGYGLTLLLHGASSAYNEFLGTRQQSEYGERGTGSIVITPEARGPDGFYFAAAEADTFEVWADVARHYHLDPSFTAIAGYSMGGYGTWKLADSFPDLFAAAQPTVGAEANSYLLGSLRNVPLMMWDTPNDELDPAPLPANDEYAMQRLGYRFEFDWFEPAEHFAFAFNDQYAPAAAYLGNRHVDFNPAHITYVVTPRADQVPAPQMTSPALDAPTTFDQPDLGIIEDHAYWLSGLRLRDPHIGVVPASSGGGAGGPPANESPNGLIEVFSHGFGVGDPSSSGPQAGAGVLTGGNIPAMVYARHYETWGEAPRIPQADELDIDAQNVAAVTIWPARAQVDCRVRLNVRSDGPLTITLAGCGRKISVEAKHVRRAPLSLSVSPRQVGAGVRATLRFRVNVLAAGKLQPVPGAMVRIDGHAARTNRRGRAILSLRFRRPGTYVAQAAKRGFRTARARVKAMASDPEFTG